MSSVVSLAPESREQRSRRSPLERAVKLHASAFRSGRVAMLAKCYQFPLPVFIEDRMMVVQSEREFEELILGYRHHLIRDGMTGVSGELTSQTDNGEHLIVTTRFTFEYIDGRTKSAESTRYVRKTSDRLVVEMVENTTFPHRAVLAN